MPRICKACKQIKLLQQLAMAKEARRLQDIDEECSKDPISWLQNHTRTPDDHWKEKGTEPFARFPSSERLPYMPC